MEQRELNDGETLNSLHSLELDCLASFISRRDQKLAEMDRLLVHKVSSGLLTIEFDAIWGRYNAMIVINLGDLRRHIAAMRAWDEVFCDFDESKVWYILIRDYARPLINDLIDIPQSINNQIQQACVRLNILRNGSKGNWEEMIDTTSDIHRNIYKEVASGAFQCQEWDDLDSILNVLWSGKESKFFRKLHGDKYHDLLAPPFIKYDKPFNKKDINGIGYFGFTDDSLDLKAILDSAESQLKNCLRAYKCFNAYATRLQRIYIENTGGVYIDD